MKNSIRTKNFVYVYLVILSWLSILISCSCVENPTNIPKKGPNTPEQKPTAESLEKLYADIGLYSTNTALGINTCINRKSKLHKRKEELYRLRSEDKITEKHIAQEIEPIDRALQELEEKLKQIQDEFSTKIKHLSLQNANVELSRKRIQRGGFSMLQIWKEAAETTKEKEAYQKIQDELQKHFNLVE